MLLLHVSSNSYSNARSVLGSIEVIYSLCKAIFEGHFRSVDDEAGDQLGLLLELADRLSYSVEYFWIVNSIFRKLFEQFLPVVFIQLLNNAAERFLRCLLFNCSQCSLNYFDPGERLASLWRE
jgi:hypothetical protein